MSQKWQGSLSDRYRPVRPLGKKAGRQTWLAEDLETQQPVVVKRLLFSPEFEWDDLKLFEREAETLKSLSHPAIPRYLDFFELDKPNCRGFALVQSYIKARSLQSYLEKGRTFSEVEVKQIAQALLNVLVYLHNRTPPVIHRDIKPSNILLGDRSAHSPGDVYLVDFGSVQTLAAKEGGTITVVGTYGYMPPEQFGGRTVPASDLYSVGATMIYLVTGKHPADLLQENLQIQFDPIVPLDRAFVQWLRAMTNPSVKQRPDCARSALRLLERPERIEGAIVPSSTLFPPAQRPPDTAIRLTKTSEVLEIGNLPFPSPFGSILSGCFLWLISFGFLLFFGQLIIILGFIAITILVLKANDISIGEFLEVRIDRHSVLFVKTMMDGNQKVIRSAKRCEVQAVIYTRRFYKSGEKDSLIEVQPKLSLLVGNQVFLLGEEAEPSTMQTLKASRLTPAETWWLAHELSEWLEVPIIREN